MHDLDNQHIVTIPLNTDLTLPYGLMYANEPSEALKKFLRIVKKSLLATYIYSFLFVSFS